jgi:BirA family biotin operon repressor/biotin-[acetyl-CoA-carboxylase] ligase
VSDALRCARLSHWEGEPSQVWEALWEVPRFEAWESLGSTNDRARLLAEEGALPFTVVTAEEQTAGRGRGAHRWQSPAALGLWISVLLRPPAADALRLAPLLVGLAACRAAERAARVSATLKWPNDVLLGDRKVAGILCETNADGGLVAGVGFNVRQTLADFPPELREQAVSLEMASGDSVRRSELGGALVREMKNLLERAPLRLEGAVASEVRRRDALCGFPVEVEGGTSGTARGVDPAGRLLVEVAPGSLKTVSAGSVRLLRARPVEAARPTS